MEKNFNNKIPYIYIYSFKNLKQNNSQFKVKSQINFKQESFSFCMNCYVVQRVKKQFNVSKVVIKVLSELNNIFFKSILVTELQHEN